MPQSQSTKRAADEHPRRGRRTVRARPGRLRGLSVLRRRSGLCGGFVRGRGALNGRKRWFRARAVVVPLRRLPRQEWSWMVESFYLQAAPLAMEHPHEKERQCRGGVENK